MRVALALCVLAACKSAPAPALAPAGDERDEGAGDLARASVGFDLGAYGSAEEPDAPARRDDDVGGTTYAGWQPQPATQTQRVPHYAITESNLDGAIEGVVTWSGAPPRTACGAGLRVGADHTVEGAIIYIAAVREGRAFASHSDAVQVGGTLVKRGCALAPVVQVIAPAPATLVVHGDADAALLRVAGPVGSAATVRLESGGAVPVQIFAGVTKLDGDSLGPAWAIGVETPYVAVTDDGGRFRIDALPTPATYDVTIFAPPSTPGGAPIVVHRRVRVAGTVKLPVALR